MTTRKPDADAITRLRAMLKPGDTVYTLVRHVSRSGMQRRISVFTIGEYAGKPEILEWSHLVARALGYRLAPRDPGVVVNGAGMDMGFAIVYELGRVLFPDGFDLAPGQYGRNGDTSGHDDDGGYALKHSRL